MKKKIKRADKASAFFEATQLAGFTETEAAKLFGRPRFKGAAEIRLNPGTTNAVQKAFVARFTHLYKRLT